MCVCNIRRNKYIIKIDINDSNAKLYMKCVYESATYNNKYIYFLFTPFRNLIALNSIIIK